AVAALILALALALPLGVAAALRPGSRLDRGVRLASLLGVCLPGFWLGPLLILVFSLQLGWLPVSGRGGAAHVVLPAVTLALVIGVSYVVINTLTDMLHGAIDPRLRDAR